MGVVWQPLVWGERWIYQQADGQLSRRGGVGLLAQLLEWVHKAVSRSTGLAAQGNGFFLLEPQFPHLEIGARSFLLKSCQQE